MKIIVASQGTNLESQIDPRFGRAKHFILVDTDTDQSSVHDNSQNWNATQGAGIQAAQVVARLGAEAVLTGHVGPKAFTTLQAANIIVYTDVSGTVKEAIEQFTSGRLTAAAKADVQGQRIAILAEIADDRAVAETYSHGQLACDTVPSFAGYIRSLLNRLAECNWPVCFRQFRP